MRSASAAGEAAQLWEPLAELAFMLEKSLPTWVLVKKAQLFFLFQGFPMSETHSSSLMILVWYQKGWTVRLNTYVYSLNNVVLSETLLNVLMLIVCMRYY